MNNEPLVSVVVPTYNRPKYLKDALKSVVNQTYKNIEIIVSDDAGNSDNYLIAISFDDSRIKYHRNSTNLGIASNNITAFSKTKGKYVADLNDDDIWEKDFLSKLVPHLEANPNLVVAFSDHYIINENGEIDFKATDLNSKLWKRDQLSEGVYQPFYDLALVHRSVPIVMAAIIRKSALDWKDFPLDVGSVYDLWLNYLACRSGGGAFYYSARLTRYRVHSNSESSQGRLRVHNGQIFCYESFLKDSRLSKFFPEFQKSLAFAYRNTASTLLKEQNFSEAVRFLLKGIMLKIAGRSLVYKK